MTKPTILISKMGAVGYSKAYTIAHRSVTAAASGEQGTTEAVLNHLSSRDDIQTVYFGQWRGNLPKGIIYVEADVAGLNDMSLAREQEERWANDIARLTSFNPKLFVTISGYASQNSWIANQDFLQCQACAVRYTGPLLNAMQQLKTPRILIINDIRNYPKEYEMTRGWNWVQPIACLSQREKDWERTISGTRWKIREVYAAAEHWREFNAIASVEKIIPCTVIGHAHIGDGKRLRHYDKVWRTILSPNEDIQKLKQLNFKIYGQGWEHFSEYDAALMPGVINTTEVEFEFSRSKTTVVTITGGELYTNKARFALEQGCLPLFYGNGGPHTMDPLGKYIALDDERRITKPGDLLKMVTYYDTHEQERKALITLLLQKMQTDWSLLDNCINDVLNGESTETDKWWNTYGGYKIKRNE